MPGVGTFDKAAANYVYNEGRKAVALRPQYHQKCMLWLTNYSIACLNYQANSSRILFKAEPAFTQEICALL